MSDIKKLILETNKTTRRGRMINNILWGAVVVLVVTSLYITYVALDLKHEAETNELMYKNERDSKAELLIIADSLKNQAQSLVHDLQISEENLEGEKAKLEDISRKYDSIRQVQLEQLEQGDELWDYAVKENTVQSYTDYAKIKGFTPEAIEKIKSLLRKTGYVMIEESNGKVLIEEVGFGFWKPNSARSIRKGVIGNTEYSRNGSERNGDVIIKGQVFVILQDSLMSGRTRWAEIAY